MNNHLLLSIDDAQQFVSILRAVQMNLGAITTLAKAENSQSAVDEYLLSSEFAGALEAAITGTECAIWSVGVLEDDLPPAKIDDLVQTIIASYRERGEEISEEKAREIALFLHNQLGESLLPELPQKELAKKEVLQRAQLHLRNFLRVWKKEHGLKNADCDSIIALLLAVSLERRRDQVHATDEKRLHDMMGEDES
jgi:hypothetical protein